MSKNVNYLTDCEEKQRKRGITYGYMEHEHDRVLIGCAERGLQRLSTTFVIGAYFIEVTLTDTDRCRECLDPGVQSPSIQVFNSLTFLSYVQNPPLICIIIY